MPEEGKKVIISVEGMSYATCAQRIEHALKRQGGIEWASVNFTTGRVLVEYDPARLGTEDLERMIERVGYGVRRGRGVLRIGGMTCTNCARTIERALSKHEGVYRADVNFATKKAYLAFNPDIVTLSDLKRVIEDTGYEIIEEEVSGERDRKADASSSLQPLLKYTDTYNQHVSWGFSSKILSSFYPDNSCPVYRRIRVLQRCLWGT
ncbi:MAG: heavy-metal-associated domain-containing protein [Candidatus Syntropharchaeia archaeon]